MGDGLFFDGDDDEFENLLWQLTDAPETTLPPIPASTVTPFDALPTMMPVTELDRMNPDLRMVGGFWNMLADDLLNGRSSEHRTPIVGRLLHEPLLHKSWIAKHRWRAMKGHILLHYFDRNAAQRYPQPYTLQDTIQAAFILAHDLVQGLTEEHIRSFSVDSGLAGFCRLHSEFIKMLVKTHHQGFWTDRPRRSDDHESAITVVREFAYLRDAEKLCPSLTDSTYMKGVVLAHKLYFHYHPGVSRASGRLYPSVRRDSAFDESVNLLNRATPEAISLGVSTARFVGENAVGDGPIKDWFSAVAKQIYNPQYALFEVSPDKDHTTYLSPLGVHQDGYGVLYEAVGRFLALAVIQENPIGVTLPNWFFSMLLGEDVQLHDIEKEENHVFKMLDLIMKATTDEELGMYPMEIDGIDFVPTLETREAIVERRLRALIPANVRRQFEALSRGFLRVIPRHITQGLLSGADLRGLVYGNPTIDVEDLIAHMQYRSYRADSTQIVWLHRFLRTLTNDELKGFLRFVTSSPQVPIGGFANINPTVKVDSASDARSLPTASTCFNTLHLPLYPTADVLRQKLLLAVGNADGAMLLL